MVKMTGRVQDFILRLMTMDVHLAVFLSIGLSVCHSAVTIINAMDETPNSGVIFLNNEAVNYFAGTLGMIAGILLLITLARRHWFSSSILAQIALFVWAFTLVMLIINGTWGGALMCFFYVVIHAYVALSTKVHDSLNLDSRLDLRYYFENQK